METKVHVTLGSLRTLCGQIVRNEWTLIDRYSLVDDDGLCVECRLRMYLKPEGVVPYFYEEVQ